MEQIDIFILKLQDLKKEMEQTRHYVAAAILRDAEAAIIKHYKDEICQPCTSPIDSHYYGLRAFIHVCPDPG